MHKLLKQAFTLIELLVVIAIIGILSGLIIVGMNGMTQKANIAKAQVFSNSLRNALMLNIVGEWKMDELTTAVDTTPIQDSWSRINNGTLSTGDALEKLKIGNDCIFGKCIQFDGNNDYITINDSVDLRLANGGTLSVWIYPKTATWQQIFIKSTDWATVANGYSLFLYVDYNLYFRTNNGGGIADSSSSNNSITLNQWQLITVTFSSSGRKIYVNGIDKTASGGGNTGLPPSVPSPVPALGIAGDASSNRFNGLMDDIRIYNVAIPVSQIKEQYYAGLNKLFTKGGIAKEEYQKRLEGLIIAKR